MKRHSSWLWNACLCVAALAALACAPARSMAQNASAGRMHRSVHWIAHPLFAVAGIQFTLAGLAVTLLLVAIVYAVWRHQAERSVKQNLLDEELRTAQELQQVLVPEEMRAVPGYRLSSAYRPAQVVGGDFFQIMPVEGGTLAVVGDVSGKGLKAAMTVALIIGALRTLAEVTGDPAKLLEGLNRRLHGRLKGGFATCLAVRLEASGECVAASAGHLAPLLNGEEVMLPGALPLGMVAAAEYVTTRIPMHAGDQLTLYTDGLPEARNAAGELFGFERMQALVAAEQDAETVAAAAAQFGQDDDVTVLTFVREAAADETFRVLKEIVAEAVTTGRRKADREER
jgi:serine phosphatase RsbU (regulator of sigma subunit)